MWTICSLTTRKHLTVWTGRHSGSFYDIMETLWSTHKDHRYHPELIRRTVLQSDPRHTSHGQLPSAAWHKTGVPAFSFPVSAYHRLGHEDINCTEKARYSVDPMETATLPMTWHFSRTPSNRCRWRPTLWQRTPYALGWTSTKGRPRSSRSMQPTQHPSSWKTKRWRRWKVSPTSAASLASWEVPMQTYECVLARQEQLSSSRRRDGTPVP